MSKTFEQGKAEVAALCDYFAKNRQAFSAPGVKEAHVRMVRVANSVLALHKQNASAKSGGQRGAIQRQIGATDAEIDLQVYDLYGLTKDEIAIVEGARHD